MDQFDKQKLFESTPFQRVDTAGKPCDLTILIISFNCKELLKSCLNSIYASISEVCEVIVIDNASVDGTRESLLLEYPFVRLVTNAINVGHTRAVNQGVRLASGRRILLLDADTELLPKAIESLCTFMDTHNDTWLAAPRTLNSDGTIQETARNFPSPLSGVFGRQSLLTRLFPNNPVTRRYLGRAHLENREPFQVEFVSAACMLFDRRVLELVGLLDEGYPGYWVDADWCKRIQNAGGTIHCIPDAVIYHHEQNKSSRKRNPSRIIDFHTGVCRFYRLHHTCGRWDPRALVVALLLAIRAMLLLIINQCKRSDNYSDPLSLPQNR